MRWWAIKMKFRQRPVKVLARLGLRSKELVTGAPLKGFPMGLLRQGSFLNAA